MMYRKIQYFCYLTNHKEKPSQTIRGELYHYANRPSCNERLLGLMIHYFIRLRPTGASDSFGSYFQEIEKKMVLLKVAVPAGYWEEERGWWMGEL